MNYKYLVPVIICIIYPQLTMAKTETDSYSTTVEVESYYMYTQDSAFSNFKSIASVALSNACSDKGWNTYKSEDGMRVPNIPMQAIKIQQRNDGQYKIYGRAHGWCVRYK